MSKTLTPEEFEQKLNREFKELISDKSKVVKLLDEAEQYARDIKMPDTYEELASNILKDVRENRKFYFKQWKSINLFVINQRKLRTPKDDDDFIIL
tara:strand:+ start:45 stop:332 length:288 start_codon:yes stop_codon:yes gene_type:complete